MLSPRTPFPAPIVFTTRESRDVRLQQASPEVAVHGHHRRHVTKLRPDHPSPSSVSVPLGTPAYMAPEMALGERVDARADLYALGCVAYYLLTGQQVFTGDTVLTVIAQHLQTVPVPPSDRTELPIPTALEQLVLACLAKKPEDRPQAARQLAQSLDAIDGTTWGEEEAGRWWTEHHPPQAVASDAITL
jgi:serine/threonine protein kinase